MDIFNLQKVEELEREIASLKHKLCEAESRANKAERSLERFLELRDTAPKDCTSGTYCKACEFVKEFCYHDYWNGSILTGYYCGKGVSCKNFIQKKVEEK